MQSSDQIEFPSTIFYGKREKNTTQGIFISGDCNVRCPYHGADCVVCIGLHEVLIEVSPSETIVTYSDVISLAFRSMAPCNLTIIAQYTLMIIYYITNAPVFSKFSTPTSFFKGRYLNLPLNTSIVYHDILINE